MPEPLDPEVVAALKAAISANPDAIGVRLHLASVLFEEHEGLGRAKDLARLGHQLSPSSPLTRGTGAWLSCTCAGRNGAPDPAPRATPSRVRGHSSSRC